MADPPSQKTRGISSPLVEKIKCQSAAAQTSAAQVYSANTSLPFSNTNQTGSGMHFHRASVKIHISVLTMLLCLKTWISTPSLRILLTLHCLPLCHNHKCSQR